MAQPTNQELLEIMKGMQERLEEQKKELEAQKTVVEMQQKDTTKLHVNSYVHKAHQRELEMKAEMEKYSNMNIKRCVFLNSLINFSLLVI